MAGYASQSELAYFYSAYTLGKAFNMSQIVLQERIESKILFIREKKVMLDRDLSSLFGVETSQLKRAVRRNIERFPEDFMFELTKEEYEILRCQIGILNWGEHSKYPPFAFTEHGVTMLASVLKSKKAVEISIEVTRAFIKLRQLLSTHEELRLKVEAMEKKYDHQFKIVFEAIKNLIEPKMPEKPERKIGFQPPRIK